MYALSLSPKWLGERDVLHLINKCLSNIAIINKLRSLPKLLSLPLHGAMLPTCKYTVLVNFISTATIQGRVGPEIKHP